MQLAAVQPDGSTLRAHLQAAAAASGRADPRILSRPPLEVRALWEAFVDLNASRPAGLGASGLPPGHIVDWQRLHGVRLTSWEVDTLQAMDRAVLAKD